MPQLLKATWTRGVLSPLAHARVDTELYQQCAARILNWHVLREGGVRRRSGTRYRGETKYADKKTRFVDFNFSAAQTYAIEMGDGYTRFWSGLSQVQSGVSPYEIVSPYDETDLEHLQWEQSGNTLYVARSSNTIKPQKLIRLGNTNWTFGAVNFKDGPYLPINDVQNEATTSAAPATAGTTTVTFANTNNINDGSGFVSTDVGRHFRLQIAGKWSWGKITVVNADDSIDVLWEDGQGGTAASISWRLGAFSDTTGYPAAVVIFQGRLFWGGTPSNPRYYAYSYSGLPEVMSPSEVDGTVTDANGGSGDILAGDEILWFKEAPRLQIGTPSAVRSLGAQDIDQVFGPRNIHQKLEIREGVSEVRPVSVGSSTVHCARFEKSIHDLFFDFQVNAIVNPEISVTAEHLTFPGVSELSFQLAPYRRLYAIADGSLISTTIDKNEKIIGWTEHDIGGGDVQSITSIAGSSQHDLYMIVRRTIGGVQKQYVETLDPDFLRGRIEDGYFHDCGATYSGAPTNVITGATWLAGETVSILADGKVLPNTAVSGTGELTLPGGKLYSKVSYGLPIRAELDTLRVLVSSGSSNGQGVGRRVKVISADVDVFETRGLKIISDSGQIDELRESPASNLVNTYDLLTGTRRLIIDGSWASEGRFSFLADLPLPVTIRAVTASVNLEG